MLRNVYRGAAALIVAILISAGGVTSANAAGLNDDVVSAVNSHRASAGQGPLQRDATLDAAAAAWAQSMSSTGVFAHSTAQWREARIAPGWSSHGENIAWGYPTASAVMQGWMNSPGHRANILNSTYTRMGVGYVASGNYWVQIFAGYAADRVPQLTQAPVPVVTGTPRVGQVLTASAGSWQPAPVSTAFQWQANGQPIAGAVSATFTPRAIHVGSNITVKVTGTRSGYMSRAQVSAPSSVVTTNLSVRRVTGADRFVVANAISKSAHPARAETVYLVTGANFPDALSAAPAAIKDQAPLLLTDRFALPASVSAEIARLAPKTVVVVGGPASVSENVLDTLRKTVPNVVRISGATRYEASRALAEYAFGTEGSASAYLSTGANFPDALSAGSAAGAAGAPVILVDGAAQSADVATRELIDDLGVTSIKVAGGPASVSTPLAQSLDGPANSVQRLSGADRFAASVAINADAYSRSKTVYIATGHKFPDALAGAVLAGKQRTPLFIVPASCVPHAVLSEIERLGATELVLLGGTASLGNEVSAVVPCGW